LMGSSHHHLCDHPVAFCNLLCHDELEVGIRATNTENMLLRALEAEGVARVLMNFGVIG
jgi:hypothetical protein